MADSSLVLGVKFLIQLSIGEERYTEVVVGVFAGPKKLLSRFISAFTVEEIQ
jgi:hypothetical protein